MLSVAAHPLGGAWHFPGKTPIICEPPPSAYALFPRSNTFRALDLANAGLVQLGCPALSALLACPHHAGSPCAQRLLERLEAACAGNAHRFAPVRERRIA